MRGIDRRTLVGGACVIGTAQRSSAETRIGVDRFGSTGSTVYLLHGLDGLSNAGRYQFAAQTIANAGYSVLLPRYFEATSDSRARYGDIRSKYGIWLRTLEAILAEPPPGTVADRVAVVGISLGGALALSLASRSSRNRAVVDFFGFEPEDLAAGRRLPPTLILHGDADRTPDKVAGRNRREPHLSRRGTWAVACVIAGCHRKDAGFPSATSVTDPMPCFVSTDRAGRIRQCQLSRPIELKSELPMTTRERSLPSPMMPRSWNASAPGFRQRDGATRQAPGSSPGRPRSAGSQSGFNAS